MGLIVCPVLFGLLYLRLGGPFDITTSALWVYRVIWGVSIRGCDMAGYGIRAIRRAKTVYGGYFMQIWLAGSASG